MHGLHVHGLPEGSHDQCHKVLQHQAVRGQDGQVGHPHTAVPAPAEGPGPPPGQHLCPQHGPEPRQGQVCSPAPQHVCRGEAGGVASLLHLQDHGHLKQRAGGHRREGEVWGEGGQGYLSANRLGECITWSHAGLTAEGDNRVLMQKVSKELMTTVKPAEVNGLRQARGGKWFAALSKLPLALHPPGVGDHRGPHLPGCADCPNAGEGEVPPALLVLKDGSGAISIFIILRYDKVHRLYLQLCI